MGKHFQTESEPSVSNYVRKYNIGTYNIYCLTFVFSVFLSSKEIEEQISKLLLINN